MKLSGLKIFVDSADASVRHFPIRVDANILLLLVDWNAESFSFEIFKEREVPYPFEIFKSLFLGYAKSSCASVEIFFKFFFKASMP